MFGLICNQLPPSIVILGLAAYAAFEWFMGKTSFGSTMGLLIEHPINSLWAALKPKDQSGPK